jgi:hypothetical protein
VRRLRRYYAAPAQRTIDVMYVRRVSRDYAAFKNENEEQKVVL